MTDTMDAMYVENGTTVNAHVFNASDYDQTDFFLRVEQIKNLNIPLCDVSLWHVSPLRISLALYSFKYFLGTPSVTYHHVVNDNVATRR